jgi:antitoxin (DNA-binding transcriptional repressor) of toxin-antitoxin stability system
MDVVLGPGWPGILLHEAVGHGLEGDFNRKKTSAFAGLMGQRVAAPGRDRGRRRHDPRPARLDQLRRRGHALGPQRADRGRDSGGLHAGPAERPADGGPATGNGRRQSYAHAPMPRMTNTIMLGGDRRPGRRAGRAEGRHLRRRLRRRAGRHHQRQVRVQLHRGLPGEGRPVGAPVKGATLIGDGATALKQIRAIGNDMALDPGIGNCGKNGQWVPVGVGQPTLLIGGLTVGGSGRCRRKGGGGLEFGPWTADTDRNRRGAMQVEIHRAKRRLSALIAAACAGDDVIIARDGVPLVRLVPVVAASLPHRHPGRQGSAGRPRLPRTDARGGTGGLGDGRPLTIGRTFAERPLRGRARRHRRSILGGRRLSPPPRAVPPAPAIPPRRRRARSGVAPAPRWPSGTGRGRG